MQLDFSEEWRILGPDCGEGNGPAAFAAAELAGIIGKMGGRVAIRGDTDATERIFVLSAGSGKLSRFSWRAAEDRVEIYGESGVALLRGVYDFLHALGARWVAPGLEGERLPRGPRLELALTSRASADGAIPAVLALAHGALLENFADYLPWAARAGYASVLICTTTESLAMEAAPDALYESLRDRIAPQAALLGLTLELGFTFPDAQGGPDAITAFADMAAARPEISVFHAALPPSARLLELVAALASALARVRPDAALGLLPKGDCAELSASLNEGTSLPPGLGLLWDPRERSWGHSLGDEASALNKASLESFQKLARSWRRAGGGSVAFLGRYEDGFLFKGAVPPLGHVIEGDFAALRSASPEESPDRMVLLCAGGRLPLAPRPNACLFPALARSPASSMEAELSDWAAAAYRSDDIDEDTTASMLGYWRELEAAWAIDLDIKEGETGVSWEPPRDWGDPWSAGETRLGFKRGRCEELFDRLRAAEAELAKARQSGNAAVEQEASEYAISDSILELNCARLSTYHELAAGSPAAAADIANLALSASGAVSKSFAGLDDPRARREMRFVISRFYDLRLRSIRRANARSGLRRLLDLWISRLRDSLGAKRVAGAYAAPLGRSGDRGLAGPKPSR